MVGRSCEVEWRMDVRRGERIEGVEVVGALVEDMVGQSS